MRNPMGLVCLLLALLSCFASAAPAGAKSAIYQTGFTRWRAAEGQFSNWTLNGVGIMAGNLQLDPMAATPGTDPYPPGGYNGHNFYNGGSFKVGEATSPIVPAS